MTQQRVPRPAARPVVADAREAASTLHRVRDLVRYAVSRFDEADVHYGHGTSEAYDEAVWLVSFSLRLPIERYADFADASVAWSEARAILDLIARRCQERQPLAYLIGEAWLCGYRFLADERALVPRSPIAEAMTTDALQGFYPPILAGEHARTPPRILDLCTGGASLAIIAAHLWPQATVVAADLSADALALARQNIQLHDLTGRIKTAQGDLYAPLARQRFDLILCNPPYVNAGSMRRLPTEYRQEPETALAGGEDGMDLVARILAGAVDRLRRDGLLVLEIGHEIEHFVRRFPQLAWQSIALTQGDEQVLAIGADALALWASTLDPVERN